MAARWAQVFVSHWQRLELMWWDARHDKPSLVHMCTFTRPFNQMAGARRHNWAIHSNKTQRAKIEPDPNQNWRKWFSVNCIFELYACWRFLPCGCVYTECIWRVSFMLLGRLVEIVLIWRGLIYVWMSLSICNAIHCTSTTHPCSHDTRYEMVCSSP